MIGAQGVLYGAAVDVDDGEADAVAVGLGKFLGDREKAVHVAPGKREGTKAIAKQTRTRIPAMQALDQNHEPSEIWLLRSGSRQESGQGHAQRP